jgi:phospholipase C
MPQIAHIVILMMENHSYDNYVGAMAGRGDGLPPGAPLTNPDRDGRPVATHHLAGTTQPREVPCQSWDATHEQWNGGACDGFVRSAQKVAARAQPPVAAGEVARIMGQWTDADLPFYWGLARTFPLADRWFGSCLGPTFPNRRFLIAGTAHGLISDEPAKCFDMPPSGTILDLLTHYGITWTNFHSTAPFRLILARLLGRPGRRIARRLAPAFPGRVTAVLHELEAKLQFTADVYAVSVLKHLLHVRGMHAFFARAAAGTLPAVSIVDPSFLDYSEETPQDVQYGERFAATVIDAVMRGPGWGRTLLVWCYDEHGGYFDHVPPPSAVEPDGVLPDGAPPGDRYDRLGFRVPAVIVSPFAKPAAVVHDTFDHASVLRLIEDKWNLPSLTRRDANAASPAVALDLDGPPAFATPPTLPAPARGYARPPRYDFLT